VGEADLHMKTTMDSVDEYVKKLLERSNEIKKQLKRQLEQLDKQ
jgi:tRNA(Phe) wybutosine-synthesizing methylase Tyw3